MIEPFLPSVVIVNGVVGQPLFRLDSLPHVEISVQQPSYIYIFIRSSSHSMVKQKKETIIKAQ